MASGKIEVDILEQCAAIGDLHHALDAGAITRGEVYAELGELGAGRKPKRTSEDPYRGKGSSTAPLLTQTDPWGAASMIGSRRRKQVVS